MFRPLIRTARSGVALAAAAVLLAACGGGDDSKRDDGSAGGASANVAMAKSDMAAYVGKPGPFPVDEPLSGPLPPGTTFAYLQCSTPICGLQAQLLRAGAKTLGVTIDIVQADPSAPSMQSAMDTIVAKKPDAVLLSPIEPSIVSGQIKALRDAGIPIIALAIADAEKYGIDFTVAGAASDELSGRLLADWVVTEKGNEGNVVFYNTPELSFSAILQESFSKQMQKLCPDCAVRSVDLSITTLGSTSASTIVSDLQAHPDTNTAVFATAEATSGLPAAMRTANLDVSTLGFGPNPATLADIKSGGVTAGLGVDFPVAAWTQIDIAARMVLDQKLGDLQASGNPPLQFLEKEDITFDPSKGWTGYPDFAQRFARLWAGR